MSFLLHCHHVEEWSEGMEKDIPLVIVSSTHQLLSLRKKRCEAKQQAGVQARGASSEDRKIDLTLLMVNGIRVKLKTSSFPPASTFRRLQKPTTEAKYYCLSSPESKTTIKLGEVLFLCPLHNSFTSHFCMAWSSVTMVWAF